MKLSSTPPRQPELRLLDEYEDELLNELELELDEDELE
jgi:hypothetical protein